MPLFVSKEVEQHPNKYIEGMDKVSICAAFRFLQGTNVQGLVSMELTQKVINIKAKGFVPYLVPSDKTSFIYLDLVANVASERDYNKMVREARAIVDQLEVMMRRLQEAANGNDAT